MSDAPIAVTCVGCDGLTFKLTGTVAEPCVECAQHGRLRAQLVITVGNRDTGAVASVNVVPGLVQATPSPYGGWRLALFPLVIELAQQTGTAVRSLREVDRPEQPLDPDGELSLHLPRAWQPDLPAAERLALEVTALGGLSRHPWWVYLGDSTDPGPPDHNKLLAGLCRAADLLCLDLVIEARKSPGDRLTWDIRFELPGSPIPITTHGYAHSLLTAIECTTVADAVYGLAERCATAPAHYLTPSIKPDQVWSEPDVDQLERRIMRDCADDKAGAQAIWRNRNWWHASLRTGEQAVRRGWEPPSPAYLGDPIPSVTCPDCHGSGSTWQGTRRCPTCSGQRRLHQGAAVVLTDLADRTIWLNWQRPEHEGSGARGSGTVVAREVAGQPIVQLGERYRLGSWVGLFGRGPEAMAEFDGVGTIDHRLCHGLVMLPEPDADPLDRYLALAGGLRPGGRLLVQVTGWSELSLGQLVHLVHGLGLALRVTVQDLTKNADNLAKVQGVRWEVRAVKPGDTPEWIFAPLRNSLPEAIDHCLRYLGSALYAAVPADPARPLPVPQQLASVAQPLELESALPRAARSRPGEPISIRLDPDRGDGHGPDQ
ncbi:hypothetical protein AB0J90_33550 [Micromonospora sp. NPDC049523]|uniref:hypothetical protein n=1 Tax=Micromonospora sp. NPDC049523 TaxID=3155921 RepID=UPI003434BB63